MATYQSKPVVIQKPIAEIYSRFCDLSALGKKIDELPADQRAKIGDVDFQTDSITINTPQVGQIKFEVVERQEPHRVVFGTTSSPVPLTMTATFKAVDDSSTEVATVIDVEIPAMLRPFVGPKLQEAADKFGDLISKLS